MNAECSDIRFGGPGHEAEYIVHVKGFGGVSFANGTSSDNYIPRKVEEFLTILLPDWNVSSRGSRIEICGRKSGVGYGDRDDLIVALSVMTALRLYQDYKLEIFEKVVDFGTLFLSREVASGILSALVDKLPFLAESAQADLLAQLMKTEVMISRFPGRCDEETSRAVLTVRNAVASAIQIQKLGDILSSSAN